MALSFLFGTGCSSRRPLSEKTLTEVDQFGRLALKRPLKHISTGPGKVTLMTELLANESAKLNYWPVGQPDLKKTIPLESKGNDTGSINLEGLEVGMKYHSTIEKNGNETKKFLFQAGRKKGESFRFLVVGDTRHGSALAHHKVVEQMSQRTADLYVHLGDFVNHGSNIPEWKEFFSIERPLLEKMPMIPVIGNHDLSRSGIFSDLFAMSELSVEKRRYYSVVYGDMAMIILDSNISIKPGSSQYQYLLSELEKLKDSKFLFVSLHHPLWSASVHHGGNKDLQKNLAPLFSKYGVKAVFSGHDHHYERSKPIDGVHYFVTGGGGSPLRPVSNESWVAKATVTYHFLEVELKEDRVEITAINHRGKVIDEVTLS